MLVVADTSPLIVLTNLGCADVLSKLFGKVVIPPQVREELASSRRTLEIRQFAVSLPVWLVEQAPTKIEPIPLLDLGEQAAISLARELNAELLLIDEAQGRTAAIQRGIRITGTIGVLESAADRGLLDLADAFARLKMTDFWISHELLDERLEKYRRERQQGN